MISLISYADVNVVIHMCRDSIQARIRSMQEKRFILLDIILKSLINVFDMQRKESK